MCDLCLIEHLSYEQHKIWYSYLSLIHMIYEYMTTHITGSIF
jgi:hypothetical protein